MHYVLGSTFYSWISVVWTRVVWGFFGCVLGSLFPIDISEAFESDEDNGNTSFVSRPLGQKEMVWDTLLKKRQWMGVPLVKIERDKTQLHGTSKPTHTCACRKGLDIEELQPSYQSRQVRGPIFFFQKRNDEYLGRGNKLQPPSVKEDTLRLLWVYWNWVSPISLCTEEFLIPLWEEVID